MYPQYIILLNDMQDEEGRNIRMIDGYKTGDKLVLGFVGTLVDPVESIYDAAEELFRMFNIDHPVQYKNRSLSVGDVVLLFWNGKQIALGCEREGFKEVEVCTLGHDLDIAKPCTKNPLLPVLERACDMMVKMGWPVSVRPDCGTCYADVVAAIQNAQR